MSDTLQVVGVRAARRTGPGGGGIRRFKEVRAHVLPLLLLAGMISTIDFATRTVVAEWATGSSSDMVQVSADGSQAWTSGRFQGEVYVTDTSSGETIRRIRTGAAPHGLTIFPQPGRYSIGHNGVYR